MQIVGVSYVVGEDGKKKTTLYVVEEFDSYYSGTENRGCIGRKTETIYAGDYDCSHLKPGMNIDICYDRAITTRNGAYQRIKKIDVLPSVKQTTTA